MLCTNIQLLLNTSNDLPGLLLNDRVASDHLQICPECQAEYQERLLKLTMTDLNEQQISQQLTDQLLQNAMTQQNPSNRMGWMAMAASIFAFAILSQTFIFSPASPTSETTAWVAQYQNIRIVINSLDVREMAHIQVDLSQNISIKGFPEQQQLSWETPLKKGKNLLTIPVVLETPQSGQLQMTYSYGDISKEVKVNIAAHTTTPLS